MTSPKIKPESGSAQAPIYAPAFAQIGAVRHALEFTPQSPEDERLIREALRELRRDEYERNRALRSFGVRA